jgi:thiamine biosynthesis lipoprotein
MGTVVTIDLYIGRDLAAWEGAEVRRQIGRASAILQHADKIISTWQPASPLSRLRAGSITIAQAPAEVAGVLERCAAARDLSRGWFDPWAMPGGVDPTGYVKGWAAQRALAAFTAPCVTGAMVNAAGDIASSGVPAPGRPFRVGIADPAAPRRLAEIAQLTGFARAIATSGTYERGDHLIDPHSGQPAARVASASVTGPDLGLADALATAVAIAGETGLAFIEPIDGYEALTIGFDGHRRWTQRFPFAPAPADFAAAPSPPPAIRDHGQGNAK